MADSNKHENQQKSLNFEIVKEMHIGGEMSSLPSKDYTDYHD